MTAFEDYYNELRSIYEKAGAPPSRAIAEASGVNRTTVAQIIKGERVATVTTIRLMTEALGGDVEKMVALRMAAKGEAISHPHLVADTLTALGQLVAIRELLVEIRDKL